MRRTHPLIVGGGPAGAMTALMLARAGQKPLLIERNAEPRAIVCGGFLGWDALGTLRQAGIDVAGLGAQPVAQLHLVAGHRTALIGLPFAAAGLSRRTLDATLLAQAARDGAAIERGTVREIDAAAGTVRTQDGEIPAPAIFLATGKHDLRGASRSTWRDDDVPVGLRVRLLPSLALQRALANRIELILFDRGYAGLILQEDGSANLCMTVAQARLNDAGGDRERLLRMLVTEAPILGVRLGQSNGWSDWAAVARVPYGWRAQATGPGLFRLGDQAAVIASLAGDGIAIALKSARMAADHYLREGRDGAVSFQRRFSKVAHAPLWIADRLRAIAENGRIAPFGITALSHFPAAARLASRATRIGAY
jgi:menaquinone-9 beta-reductase